jgi:hypothetical protein
MLFVIKITLFYACLYKYNSLHASESSYRPPSCAKIYLRRGSGRGAEASGTLTGAEDRPESRSEQKTACGSRSRSLVSVYSKDYNGKVA